MGLPRDLPETGNAHGVLGKPVRGQWLEDRPEPALEAGIIYAQFIRTDFEPGFGFSGDLALFDKRVSVYARFSCAGNHPKKCLAPGRRRSRKD